MLLFLRTVFMYSLTIVAGATIFGGVSWLISLIFPSAAPWVFIVLMACWIWLGWVHASRANRTRRLGAEHGKSLNQRLDEMGPHHRAIFGTLSRLLAIIESAALAEPPRMTPMQLELAIELLESSTVELKEAAKESQR